MKNEPLLILKRLDDAVVAPLGYSHHIKLKPNYNEVSTLTFTVPAYVDGIAVPYYDDLVGMMLVEMDGVARFILVDPTEKNDGIKREKECKAYSLEYEFSYKNIFIENGTYKLWDPIMPENTVIGMILKEMPSWHIGTIDADLLSKYRTFEVDQENCYNFIKDTIQKKYGCIFDFDTMERTINVRSTESNVPTRDVYLSPDNLIKDIQIDEDTESIVNCVGVYGADGVDILSVNPMGTNKIYNLDYLIETGKLSGHLAEQWNLWKTTFETEQVAYNGITMQKMCLTGQRLAEQAKLTDLKNEHQNLEDLMSVAIEATSMNITPEHTPSYYRSQIAVKDSEIAAQESVIAALDGEIAEITEEQIEINAATSLSAFFTSEELAVLSRYIKEDNITESSFVLPAAKEYNTESRHKSFDVGATISLHGGSNIDNCIVTKVEDNEHHVMYSIRGGNIDFTGVESAEVIRATCEIRKPSNELILSAYMANSTYTGISRMFPNSALSITGHGSASSDAENGDGTYLTVTITQNDAYVYFTESTTEYEQFAVEWDLYDYGKDALAKLAYPSYTFKIDAANFISLDAFKAFRDAIRLGDKIYLEISDGRILQPVFIGVSLEWEDIDNLSLEFSDKYISSDNAFSLVDLLEQSVSMGHTLDSNRFNYSRWMDSGANNAVKDYMSSALDVAKQEILSSTGQDVSWGSEGLRFRKKGASSYEDEQIWIANNKILFTDDNWDSVKGLIGKFTDKNKGDLYGIMMPYLQGTILAGEDLIIESEKSDGGIATFRVDGDGASLYNSQFDLYNATNSRKISINPDVGIVIGNNISSSSSDVYSWTTTSPSSAASDQRRYYTGAMKTVDGTIYYCKVDPNKAVFWASSDGNVYVKGNIDAGTIDIGGSDNTSFHVDANGNMWSGSGTYANAPFKVSSQGDVEANSVVMRDGNYYGGYYFSSNGELALQIDYVHKAPSPTDMQGVFVVYDTSSRLTMFEFNQYMQNNGWFRTDFKLGLSNDIMAYTIGDGSHMFWFPNQYDFENGLYAWRLLPESGYTCNIGSSSSYWNTIYCQSSAIDLSDRNEKHDIVYNVPEKYERLFKELKPVIYKFNENTSNRDHFGFISQDVEDGLASAGLTPQEFAGFIKSPIYDKTDERGEPIDDSKITGYRYGLRYGEFIALNTMMIQKLEKEVADLKTEITKLKGNNNE